MPALDASFAAMMAALAAHYGSPAPDAATTAAGPDPFPALVAALLARATEPRKAARALDVLAESGLLDPAALAGADVAEVDDALKSAGIAMPSRALAPLRRLSQWLVGRGPDASGDLGEVATETLREELARLNGIGPATADALLLLALRRPVYPLDRSTYRILVRHGWIDAATDHDDARDAIERQCPDDPDTLARLSDWLARVGRDFCRPRAARCDRCPLRPFLPDGGPIEPEAFSE